MVEAAKTALVTGGARRIGAAIVEDLAAHGFAVVIHCNRSRDEAAELAARITRSGGRAAVVTADLTETGETEGLLPAAVAALGPIGLLVNNASIFENDSLGDFQPGVWERHFAIHVKAPALLARSFAAALPADSKGLVVNVIDQRVWKPTPQYFSYTLSKSALWTATRTMAQSLAPNIRVNALGPGPTLANVRQASHDFAAQVDGILLRKAPDLGEFGAAIRYLWDAPSVTGQMIALDGGQHLAWRTPDVTGMVE